jgi:predicted RNA-binding protein
MCESTLVFEDERENKLLESIARIAVTDSKLVCTTIYGEVKEFRDLKIIDINFIDHKVSVRKS